LASGFHIDVTISRCHTSLERNPPPPHGVEIELLPLATGCSGSIIISRCLPGMPGAPREMDLAEAQPWKKNLRIA
jgi:hypothetical protein